MRERNLPVVSPDESLLKGLAVIDASGVETALVVEDGRLVGLLTDGDARRALLSGKGLDCLVSAVMQRRFTTVGPDMGRVEVLDIMKARTFKQIPVVDDQNRLVGLHLLRDLLGAEVRPNVAMILCGGLGTRLRPITETIPKPMIPVAGRPILERIVLHLVGHGFRRIFLAVHYLGEMIESHFGDGAALGCSIEYIHESKPLGTGGAFGLLPRDLEHPVLVMNGDLITQFDAGRMMEAHLEQGNLGTIGVQSYAHEVPFGVLETEGSRVVAMREKPSLNYLVNAGIYILDAGLRERVAPGEPTTVPAILEGCLGRGEQVGCFHVDGDWMDVGRHEELKKARGQA